MPSTRPRAGNNPSRNFQKGYRHDDGRSQLVAEGKGSVNEAQTDKLFHSEADNTVLTSKIADSSKRSFSGYILSHPEGIPQCTSAQSIKS
ncbi:hypothetical protein O181_130125 [Austropuccinia psidii MF-1]|uniref:Uncharacterized protein n=1 Tax=Austropuccinia psidii MF-1 TaxID=1389203 RepID=A0A9Q3L375_9BASI|nr:hypothetical protein [Austropuccinia psidii MF-1]